MKRTLVIGMFTALLGLTGCGDDDDSDAVRDDTPAAEGTDDAAESDGGGGAECEGANHFLTASDPDVQTVIDDGEAIQDRISLDPTPDALAAAVADAEVALDEARAFDRDGLCENDIADLDFAVEQLEGMARQLG